MLGLPGGNWLCLFFSGECGTLGAIFLRVDIHLLLLFLFVISRFGVVLNLGYLRRRLVLAARLAIAGWLFFTSSLLAGLGLRLLIYLLWLAA